MNASIFIGLVVAVVSFAQVSSGAPDVKKLKAERDKMATDIEAASASHLTCRADSDCLSLEIGRKPCGGAWKFVVTSKSNPKLGELKKKVAALSKADEAYNKAAELMSDCSMAMAPEVACVAKKCRAKENAAEDLKPQ